FTAYLICLLYIIIGRRSSIHDVKANAFAFQEGLTFYAVLEIIDGLRRVAEQTIVINTLQDYFPVFEIQALLWRFALPQYPGGNCSSRSREGERVILTGYMRDL